MITIIHGADFHLDSPFSGLTPKQAVERRQEQRQMLLRLVQCAQEQRADIVLLSGDIFDGETVYRETVEGLADALAQLTCPVFIAAGNHDYYAPRSPYATVQWPANVHVFSSVEVESVVLPDLNCTVHGASFVSPKMDYSPLEGFSAPADGRMHVMTLHGALDGTDYAPLSPNVIANSGLNYLALGHVHQYSGMKQEGRTSYAYSGCPEGRGFDELGEKGVVCVRLDENRIDSQFIPLCRRRYEIISVDVTGAESVLSAITNNLPDYTEMDSYRIRLVGERQQDTLNLRTLRQELATKFFSVEIKDNTRPTQMLWARRKEDNLTGLFLQELSVQIEQQGEDDTLILAVRYGLAALENREDVSP